MFEPMTTRFAIITLVTEVYALSVMFTGLPEVLNIISFAGSKNWAHGVSRRTL